MRNYGLGHNLVHSLGCHEKTFSKNLSKLNEGQPDDSKVKLMGYINLTHEQSDVVCRSIDIYAKPSKYASEEGRRAASEEQISASEGPKCI